jgi:hypothetical protein
MKRKISKTFQMVQRNQSGLAMVEFAVSLPFFIGLTVGGVETANYASIVMQLNQITLHTADSAARIGANTVTGGKTISEAQINDVFQGSMREGDSIGLREANALIILTSFEEATSQDLSEPKYRIRWQRCAGASSIYRSNYGTRTDSLRVDGIGPAGRQVKPPPGGAVMFVELQYFFKPLIVNGFTQLTDHTIRQYGSMVVREQRDLTGPPGSVGIYNDERVTKSNCHWDRGTGLQS